ncbi:MAG: hypothetical protein KKA97_00415, partial [Actinobacteria bacterium]|nr:hypothetical protein [Actinomycetota bacterium]
MSGIRVPRTLAWVLAVVVAASSCSVLGSDTEEAPVEAPTSAAVEEALVDSQFTRDGTFQSHLDVKGAKGMDMVLTLYPTKSTPRTNEWYP